MADDTNKLLSLLALHSKKPPAPSVRGGVSVTAPPKVRAEVGGSKGDVKKKTVKISSEKEPPDENVGEGVSPEKGDLGSKGEGGENNENKQLKDAAKLQTASINLLKARLIEPETSQVTRAYSIGDVQVSQITDFDALIAIMPMHLRNRMQRFQDTYKKASPPVEVTKKQEDVGVKEGFSVNRDPQDQEEETPQD